jgi:hypothetical protein
MTATNRLVFADDSHAIITLVLALVSMEIDDRSSLLARQRTIRKFSRLARSLARRGKFVMQPDL